MSIKVKRVYDAPSSDDGFRILVDRIWPRGLSTESAGVDLWMRDVAPSTELRHWFNHETEKWPEFRIRYERELRDHGELLDLILDTERHRGGVTLLFGAHDVEHNEAIVIAETLAERPAHAHH